MCIHVTLHRRGFYTYRLWTKVLGHMTIAPAVTLMTLHDKVHRQYESGPPLQKFPLFSESFPQDF